MEDLIKKKPREKSREERKQRFISKARIFHNGAFNYDKVVYFSSDQKVVITCLKHGDFLQVPQDHLRGNGCLVCNGRKKISRHEFIDESNKIHNNKYEYDKVNYVNKSRKVIITCKKHGDFLQIPNNHLNGHGCMECSGKTQKDTSRFIKEAIEIHGLKYTYDKVNYVNSHTKIIITCAKHGDFHQVPSSHLNGVGCMVCCGKAKKNTDLFIKEANEMHNSKYEYNKVNYVGNNKKVIITCKKHGDFMQVPKDHLKGIGCEECGGTKKSNTKDFIEAANKTHDFCYNYNKTIYKTRKCKVIITCGKHGDFEQLPYDHLNGRGCQKCSSSTGEKEIFKILNKMNMIFEHQFKFDGCFHKGKLIFDFAVFIDNKIKLIEFNGIQHYKYVSYFHKKNGWENSIIRDKIKVNFAKENNLDLLIIPYSFIDRIESLLYDFLVLDKIDLGILEYNN